MSQMPGTIHYEEPKLTCEACGLKATDVFCLWQGRVSLATLCGPCYGRALVWAARQSLAAEAEKAAYADLYKKHHASGDKS